MYTMCTLAHSVRYVVQWAPYPLIVVCALLAAYCTAFFALALQDRSVPGRP